ncbi:MAG TPA: glycosyltransferase [Ilumatobacteraceae bacterium]
MFSSTSGLGHVQPMVPLARALQARGHEVRWATGADACAWLERLGFATVEAGPTQVELAIEHDRRWPDDARRWAASTEARRFARLFGEVAAPLTLGPLANLVSRWRPDVMVNDVSELAAPLVATLEGVAHATHAVGPAIPSERIAAAADAVAPLWSAAGVAPHAAAGLYDGMYIDIYPASMAVGDASARGEVVWRRPESGDAMPGERLLPEIDNALRLRPDRPNVYLTFGTSGATAPGFAAAIAAVARMDVTVIATVGPRGDVNAFGRLPAHVHVVGYVPQSLLVPHCSAVVSHAGSGVILNSLARGLPQLCLPLGGDQFANAQACAALGAGLALSDDEVTADAIERDLTALLTHPSYRAAAMRVRDEIAMMPSPGDVATELEWLGARLDH